MRYPALDARRMGQVLLTTLNFSHVRYLRRKKETTKRSLLKTLHWLSQQIQSPQDTVLIYISSHGVAVSPTTNQPAQRYIVTSDTTRNIQQTALALSEVLGILRKLPSKQIVLVLATCYTQRVGEKGAKQAVSSLNTGAIQILSATGPASPAFEDPKLKSDVYTHYLMQCMRSLTQRKKAFTAVDAHLCAAQPTYKHIQSLHRTVQVPMVASTAGYNRDIYLWGNGPQRIGYLQIDPLVRYKGRWFIRHRSLQKGVLPQAMSPIELEEKEGSIPLTQGTYILEQQTEQGKVLQRLSLRVNGGKTTRHSVTPDAFSLLGGFHATAVSAGHPLGGGLLGYHSRFFSVHLGVWGNTTTDLASSGSSLRQMMSQLSVRAGYRWSFERFEWFLGGTAGFSLFFQESSTGLRVQPIGLFGGTSSLMVWMTNSFGFLLIPEIGVALYPSKEESQPSPAATLAGSVHAGVIYRFQ